MTKLRIRRWAYPWSEEDITILEKLIEDGMTQEGAEQLLRAELDEEWEEDDAEDLPQIEVPEEDS